MAEYQILSKRFRPSKFSDVVGQAPIVTTLINAIKFDQLASAYLFCGTRGTGKTTLARLFAKALNCKNRQNNYEPCNQCSSCKEIASSSSLDVLEIDGASHRGIDDIRKINETVGFTPAYGKFKIYLIDEVHMLTKEAFNALLKTLEEPPPNVKFFFATTEPHKLPATILSRCQRFQLKRISIDEIIAKLQLITKTLSKEVESGVFYLVARIAEGSLRDAESLFEQILSFHEEKISLDSTTLLLGLAPHSLFFELDQAVKGGDPAKAFKISEILFKEGKDPLYFIHSLIDHYRNILVIKLDPQGATYPHLNSEGYLSASKIYSQHELLHILEYLIDKSLTLKNSVSPQIAIEVILLHIIQHKKRLSIETIVEKLSELEKHAIALSEKAPIEEPKAMPPPISMRGKDENLMRFAAVELEGALTINSKLVK